MATDEEMQTVENLLGTLEAAQSVLRAGMDKGDDPYLWEGVRIAIEHAQDQANVVRNAMARMTTAQV